jgi:hypothetical protein
MFELSSVISILDALEEVPTKVPLKLVADILAVNGKNQSKIVVFLH